MKHVFPEFFEVWKKIVEESSERGSIRYDKKGKTLWVEWNRVEVILGDLPIGHLEASLSITESLGSEGKRVYMLSTYGRLSDRRPGIKIVSDKEEDPEFVPRDDPEFASRVEEMLTLLGE